MARIDKFEPKAGGFRAPLAANWSMTNTPVGVGLDSNGRVVEGAGNTGIVGVVCTGRTHRAADIVDVMTDGDLVEFDGSAGTSYFAANTDGTVGTAGDVYVGHTVESSRLVVRLRPSAGGGA